MIVKIILIILTTMSFVTCTDDIDKSNRYTFTGETITDFILNRSDRYSHFIEILKRAKLLSLLSTYGRYTLFLPDNEAVEKYISEQDSIYHSSKDTYNPVWTGITSPFVEDLSDSMSNVIARMHLIEQACRTSEMGEGAISMKNAAGKYLGVNYKVFGEKFSIMIDNKSAIVSGDNEVENGIVHAVDKVIDPMRKLIPRLISSYEYFSLFEKALVATGYSDSLLQIDDDTFFPEKIEYKEDGSYYGVYPVYTPKTKNIRYTAFIETDDVFRANGIETLDELKSFAEKWYGTEDRDNPCSPRNALYKFIAYHFVNRDLPYNLVVPYNITIGSRPDFFEKIMLSNHDRCDYYETALGPLMKVVKPLTTSDRRNIYINYNKRENPYNMEMRRHLNVRIIGVTEFVTLNEKYSTFNQMAENGVVHPIDKILVFNENEMYGNILNERIRIDVASLIPELSSNGIRYLSGVTPGVYKISEGYSESLRINSGFLLYETFQAYFCDDILLCGPYFDISFRLPKLPPRTYEVRIGYMANTGATNPYRYVQLYFDGKVVGNPFDVLMLGDNSAIGWVRDVNTYDNGVENDKMLRNKGWMKAPDVFNFYNNSYQVYASARHSEYNLRRIVTKQYIGSENSWLRIRDLGGRFTNYAADAMCLDYIELVPLHIVNDPVTPEDRY